MLDLPGVRGVETVAILHLLVKMQSIEAAPAFFKESHLTMRTSLAPQSRTTMLAVRTLERVQASLDSASLTRLAWLQHHWKTGIGLKAQSSVLLRRALAAYVDHLCQLGEPDEVTMKGEIQALRVAAKGSGSAR